MHTRVEFSILRLSLVSAIGNILPIIRMIYAQGNEFLSRVLSHGMMDSSQGGNGLVKYDSERVCKRFDRALSTPQSSILI